MKTLALIFLFIATYTHAQTNAPTATVYHWTNERVDRVQLTPSTHRAGATNDTIFLYGHDYPLRIFGGRTAITTNGVAANIEDIHTGDTVDVDFILGTNGVMHIVRRIDVKK